eukprot:5769504-Alexandrium_andersonii.AAC.1
MACLLSATPRTAASLCWQTRARAGKGRSLTPAPRWKWRDSMQSHDACTPSRGGVLVFSAFYHTARAVLW